MNWGRLSDRIFSGRAQVNGRNALTWDEKFALDVWYVQNQSLWLDLRIVVKTFFVVFGRRNVNSTNASTMEEFMGDGNGLAVGLPPE